MNQRRPNSREVNPEDLFRPEPAQSPYPPTAADGYGYPGPGGGPQEQQQAYPAADAPPAPDGAWGGPGQGVPGGPGAAAATQYLPPYPAGDPSAGAPTMAAPQFPSQQQQQPQPYGRPQAAFGGPSQPPAPVPAPYGGRPDGQFLQHMQGGSEHRPAGGRRPSGKVIAGVVVGACAVVGILAGALLGGEDGAPSNGGIAASAAPSTSAATRSAPPSSAAASAAPAVDPALKAQAESLSGLLATASNSRGSVVAAVGAIRGCQDLAGARQRLIDASGQRQQLVSTLAALQVDKLPDGARLSAQLQAAWKASAHADEEYAAWAADSVKSCDKHHRPAAGPHRARGDAASGVATAAKKQASALWNPIARRTELPARSYTQL